MAEGKGMSKGCLVALIVVGIIVILAAIAAVTCYIYRDDLVKDSAASAVNTLKEQVQEQSPEGVDVTTFVAVADGFVEQVKAEELTDERLQRLGLFLQELGSVIGEEEMTAEQVMNVQDEMVDLYPDLEILLPPPAMESIEADTTMVEEEAPTE